MLNQHRNPSSPDRTARAPYNFVPLPECVRDVPDDTQAAIKSRNTFAGLSGHFECELTTSAPMFIRGPLRTGAVAQDKESKDVPDFFSLDGGKTPLIPGSSLRGMLHGLVEIVTWSKLNWVTDARAAYRAVDTTSLGEKYRARIMQEDARKDKYYTPKVKAGYIRKCDDDTWRIQPAREYDGVSFGRIGHRRIPDNLQPWEKCKNASVIYIQPGAYQYQEVREGFLHIRFARPDRMSAVQEPGLKPAVLAVSGKMLSKRSEAVIYAPNDDIPQARWLPLRYTLNEGKDEAREIDLERDYINQLSPEQEALLGPKGALRDRQPVFYLEDGGHLVFFGHTMMMRVPYAYSPRDLVPEALRDENKIDMADALFGRVLSKRAQDDDVLGTFAGRVFIGDGRCISNLTGIFEDEISPRVLATPKTTTFQHYMQQGRPDDQKSLDDYDNKHALVRGHKLYWHKNNRAIKDIAETDSYKLNRFKSQFTRIRPLKTGARFRFTVRFENLTEVELGALAWALALAARPDLRLKLGMGKPLGMGAVAIASRLHLIDRASRYMRLCADGVWATGEQAAEETEATRQRATQVFERWLLAERDINPDGGVARVEDLPRMQALLALLSWPGPDPEQTRYMEIERPDLSAKGGKRNEYRGRPVLPSPASLIRSRATTVTQPAATTAPIAQTQTSAQTPTQSSLLQGVIMEIRPDKRRGRVKDAATGREYRFDTQIIDGNTPGNGKAVEFRLDGERVVWLKRK